MTCAEARSRLGALLDGELDTATQAAVEAHVAGCDACESALARHRALGDALRAHVSHAEAPAALRAWAEAAMRGEAAQRPGPAPAAPRAAVAAWPMPGWAAAALALAAFVAIALPLTRGAIARDAIARELVGAHVRAALTGHVSDVISTSQHTVKPWFNGRLDFSPPVVDLADDGFPLEGGRLDYVAERPVAVLVFRRNLHPIDLFVWPAHRGAPWPAPSARDGYQIAHRSIAGMECWAVSDLNAPELHAFLDRYAERVRAGR